MLGANRRFLRFVPNRRLPGLRFKLDPQRRPGEVSVMDTTNVVVFRPCATNGLESPHRRCREGRRSSTSSWWPLVNAKRAASGEDSIFISYFSSWNSLFFILELCIFRLSSRNKTKFRVNMELRTGEGERRIRRERRIRKERRTKDEGGSSSSSTDLSTIKHRIQKWWRKCATIFRTALK